jgi:hypothetical protein
MILFFFSFKQTFHQQSEILEHQNLRNIQRKSFNEQVFGLRQKECVILLDYTRFHETAAVKLHDLNFTIYHKSTHGTLCHEFLDFFCDASHEWKFTQEGVTRLSNIVDLKSFHTGLHIWADNAFHNNFVLHVFRRLAIALEMTITVCFFAPHHGWSICDSHFGQGKVKLRRDFSLHQIKSVSDIVSVFKELSNTTVELIEKIPEQTNPKEKFKPQFGKMRNYYCWEFLSNGTVFCKQNFRNDEKVVVELKN